MTAKLLVLGAFLFALALPQGAVAEPPPNDDFDAVTLIPIAFSALQTIDTTEATTAADDPFCFGRGATIWYTFTPTEDMRIESRALQTFGYSPLDPTLSAYTGTRGALTQVACNDNFFDSDDPTAIVAFDAMGEIPYHLMLGSANDGPGGPLLVFEVQRPLAVQFSINPSGSVNRKTGAATITGTVTCSRPASGQILASLRQVFAGRLVAQGEEDKLGVACSPTGSPWAVTIASSTSVLFGAGKATASWRSVRDIGEGAFCDAQGCQSWLEPDVMASSTVRLRSR